MENLRDMLVRAIDNNGDDKEALVIMIKRQLPLYKYGEPEHVTLEDVSTFNFDTGYGAVEGPQILAWSRNFVYFMACYDGSQWIDSLPLAPAYAKPYYFYSIGGG